MAVVRSLGRVTIILEISKGRIVYRKDYDIVRAMSWKNLSLFVRWIRPVASIDLATKRIGFYE